MDDRKEDEDDDPIPRRNLKSFSQPLGRDAVAAATAYVTSTPVPNKRSSARKHSLDGTTDPMAMASPSPADPDTSSSSARSLSYPNYNYASPPPPTYQHSSSDEILFSNPNLPHPLPPHHHSVVSGSSLVSRRPQSSSFSSSADGAATMTLDRAMSEFGGAPGTLPEFMGTGGGSGIFRVPVRAAMHAGRPPALELRPHPLRETQFGSFLRTIACTETQLWAGQESGLRFWSFSEVFEGWNGGSGAKRGDEESAPFRESGKTSPTLCLAVDEANGLMWSGHKDGKIRSWKIEKDAKVLMKRGSNPFLEEEGAERRSGEGGEGYQFKEGLAWQAHRTPVFCIAISSYGKPM